MNAGIKALEKELGVAQGKLNDYHRKLERLIERKPIVEKYIQDAESEIQDLEVSIFILKSMDKE
ncbi:hypothetical protein [Bacillus toyonensis]|uniref:hypothetical protein n=1 Tax=Bacillus toyonensis TaxID=155322 RepID=UPI000BEFBA1F|nr:hypothetical protein [Bacillus toyonensis]PEK00308.1 hypothetical protein CN688_00140 [Bacillus toyonensis]PEK75592.1 hypothetical protein CN594_30160 [Bacillus toyonensis]PEO43696.1 hypothetical protein CN579_32800 [Bacillus toyonensis]PFY28522.1 hypothetical protein COL54_34615 [Bacillus toyonensis]PFY28713.1 hypothetical protein COL55_34305 [Bacillus toyonensis]